METQYLSTEEYKKIAKDNWLNPPRIAKLLELDSHTVYKFFRGNHNLRQDNIYKIHCLLTSPFPYMQSAKLHKKSKENDEIDNTEFLTPDEYKVLAKQRYSNQAQIARDIGCDPSTICYFFKGKRPLKKKTRYKLHTLLTMPLEEFELKVKSRIEKEIKHKKEKNLIFSNCKCSKCNRRFKEADKEKESITINMSAVNGDDKNFEVIVCRSCATKFIAKMDNVPDWILQNK